MKELQPSEFLSIQADIEIRRKSLNVPNLMSIIKDMKENHDEFEIKENTNTIIKKADLAYAFWILDYPKKKEKDVIQEIDTTPTFRRFGEVTKLSIEEQKQIILAPTLI